MNVFVCGTLMSLALRRAVAGGRDIETIDAQLDGYEVRPVAGDVIPLIRVCEGEVAQGLVLCDVDAVQRARLDAYQGAFGYEPVDMTVQTPEGPREAVMHVPPGDRAVAQGEWSLTDWALRHERPAVLAATELFAHEPPLSQDQMRRMWHMFEKRAWAKTNAMSEQRPTTLRYHAQPGDVSIVSKAPPQGQFFGLQAIEVTHRQFNSARSDILPREVFVGIDAAVVLPYDVKRDRILLVEQIRMGPVVRCDPQPWVLEPIAGIVDARETPRQTALRESQEEAGLVDLDLREIAAFYPSPGSSTDYFHSYLALCDLPDDHKSFGGLDAGAEDLRLHLLSFDQAMGLLRSGEINAGPLIMMLYYLAAERSALRAQA